MGNVMAGVQGIHLSPGQPSREGNHPHAPCGKPRVTLCLSLFSSLRSSYRGLPQVFDVSSCVAGVRSFHLPPGQPSREGNHPHAPCGEQASLPVAATQEQPCACGHPAPARWAVQASLCRSLNLQVMPLPLYAAKRPWGSGSRPGAFWKALILAFLGFNQSNTHVQHCAGCVQGVSGFCLSMNSYPELLLGLAV